MKWILKKNIFSICNINGLQIEKNFVVGGMHFAL